MPKSGKKPLIALGFLCLSTVCLAGGYYAYNAHLEKQAIILEQKQAAEEKKQEEREARIQERKRINEKFEALLNGLIMEIGEEARKYKQQRHVYKELLDPYNFKNQPSAAQTYKSFIEVIAPTLRNQSNAVMNVFSKYQDLADTLLEDIPEERKTTFLTEWNKMQEKLIQKYIDFFEHEEKIIQAHKNILEFYYKNTDSYEFKEMDGRINFLDTGTREKEKDLISNIKNLLEYKP
tara:strand:+ start:442 stop:1146 length:705 start_codon:yes stop_codon:yes gene_type:complete